MKFQDITFADELISLDDNEFHGCTFKRCTLEYSGGQPPTIQKCIFEQSPQIIFSGTAADTLNFLTSLYHGGFKPIIEKTFDSVRGNARRHAPPRHDPPQLHPPPARPAPARGGRAPLLRRSGDSRPLSRLTPVSSGQVQTRCRSP